MIVVFRILLVIAVVTALTTPAQCQPSREIHIGITLPLTGPASAYGSAAQNGFLLAKEMYPQELRDITLHFEDHQLRPTLAVSAYSSLQRRFPILAHYDFGSATSLAIAPIAAKRNRIFISSAYDPAVSQARPSVYRFANSTSDYALVLLNGLRARNLRRFTIMVSQNAFFEQFVAAFRDLLLPEESLETLEVSPDESDLGPLIVKVRQHIEKSDALGLFMFTEQALNLLRRCEKGCAKIQLFGTDSFEELATTGERADFTTGLLYPNSTVQPEFLRHYEKRFSSTSHVTFAASSFDLALLLAEGVAQCHECSAIDVKIALESQQARRGMLGEYRYRESLHVGKHFSSRIALKQL